MEAALPEAYAELNKVRDVLEKHYKDMQDIEFTIQQNKLYMLQTRSGKRSAAASLRIAVEMAEQNLIDRDTAIMRVNPASLDQLLHPTLDPKATPTLFAKGLPASPGAASAPWSSPPTKPSCAARKAIPSSLSASKPARKTSTACTPPAASSPPAAA